MSSQEDRLDKTNAGGELGGTTFGQQPGQAGQAKEHQPDAGKKPDSRQPASDADKKDAGSR